MWLSHLHDSGRLAHPVQKARLLEKTKLNLGVGVEVGSLVGVTVAPGLSRGLIMRPLREFGNGICCHGSTVGGDGSSQAHIITQGLQGRMTAVNLEMVDAHLCIVAHAYVRS